MSKVDTQQSDSAAKPPGRRKRRMKRIVMLVVAFLGLAVAADFGLAAMAEHTISQRAREQLGLRTDPNVTIHGFPFITQALSGHYEHISVQAKGIRVNETLERVAIQAELYDVSAPLSDLLSGNVSNVTIGRLEGQVRLKENVIAHIPPLNRIENFNIEPTTEEYVRQGAAAGAAGPREAKQLGAKQEGSDGTDSGATPEKIAGDGDESTTGIRISGEVTIAGEHIEIFAFAIIKLHEQTITIDPKRLQFARNNETTVVPPAVQKQLLPNFKVNISTLELPFTVTPTDIDVTSSAVIIKGTAKNISFSELSIGGPS